MNLAHSSVFLLILLATDHAMASPQTCESLTRTTFAGTTITLAQPSAAASSPQRAERMSAGRLPALPSGICRHSAVWLPR